jgi:outer membrane protein OmpA-like peptidoglycan-associated protein
MRLVFTLAAGAVLLLPAVAGAQQIEGLYIAAGAGANKLERNSGKLGGAPGRLLDRAGLSREVSLDWDWGWAGVGSVGYGFGNGLRLEVEGSYRSNELDGVTVAGYRLPLRHGNARNYGVMVNTFYDFDLSGVGISSSAVMPYIGAGIGYLWRDHDDVSGAVTLGPLGNLGVGPLLRQLPGTVPPEVLNSTASVSVDSNARDGNFALQGIAGMAFPIGWVPGLAATLEYRFTGTDKIKLRTTATARAGTASTQIFNSEVGYDNFNHSIMVGLRYAFNAPRPVAPAPAAPLVPAATPAPARTYLVFFDFDRADLTERARQIIAEAAQNAGWVQTTRIEVAGHADRAGSPQYNQRLSLRRGEAVAAELARQGIQRAQITVQAFGESRPLVATADGVREPQNRRVEIVLR